MNMNMNMNDAACAAPLLELQQLGLCYGQGRQSPRWILQDVNLTVQAGAVLSALPQGSDRDQACGAFVSSYAFSHPRKAADWVKSIEDPTTRANAADVVARHWTKHDPASAAAWRAGLAQKRP